MATRLKLKSKFKNIIVLLVLLVIGVAFLIYKHDLKEYHNSYKYKLTQVGYDEETTNIIISKLDDQELDIILKYDKNDIYSEIVGEKYFIKNNLQEYIEYYNKNTNKNSKDVVALVNVGATKDWYLDSETTIIKNDYSTLVNKFNLLDKDYKVDSIKKFSSTYAYGSVSAEEECYNAFISMAKDAKKDNISLVLTSGYRTYKEQESVYKDFEKKYGKSYADSYAARPGASEHETGLALDIFALDANTMDTFKNSKAYIWLSQNAQNYGFIERYPEGKDYITGYAAEAWHWRYIGENLAKKVKNENITYDEYYAFYLK